MCEPCASIFGAATPWDPNYRDFFGIDERLSIATATESQSPLIVQLARFPEWQLFPILTYQFSSVMYDNNGLYIAEVEANQTYRVFFRANEISLWTGTRIIKYIAGTHPVNLSSKYFVYPNNNDFYEQTGSIYVQGGGWSKIGNIVTGAAASNGDNLYFAFASDDFGKDFTLTFDPKLEFIAVLRSATLLTPIKENFNDLWRVYQPLKTPVTYEELPTFEFRSLGEIIILTGVPSNTGGSQGFVSQVSAIITFPKFAQTEAEVAFSIERTECGCGPHMLPLASSCSPASSCVFAVNQLFGFVSIPIDSSHGTPTYWNCEANFWWGGESALFRLVSVSGLLNALGLTAIGIGAVCEHETPSTLSQGSGATTAFLHRRIPPYENANQEGFADYNGYQNRVFNKDERYGNVPGYNTDITAPSFWNREVAPKTRSFKKNHWKNPNYAQLSLTNPRNLRQRAGDTPAGAIPHEGRLYIGERLVLDAFQGHGSVFNLPSNFFVWTKDGEPVPYGRYLVIPSVGEGDAAVYVSTIPDVFPDLHNAWDITVAASATVEVSSENEYGDFHIAYDYAADDSIEITGELSEKVNVTFEDVESLLALGSTELGSYLTIDLPEERSVFQNNQVNPYTGQINAISYRLHDGCKAPELGDIVELTEPVGTGADLRFTGWPLGLSDVGAGTGYVKESGGATSPYHDGVVKDSAGSVKGGITVKTDGSITRTIVETYEQFDHEDGQGPVPYLNEYEETSDAGSTPLRVINPTTDAAFAFGGQMGPNQIYDMVRGWGGLASCRLRQPTGKFNLHTGEILVMKRSHFVMTGTTYYSPTVGQLYALIRTFNPEGVQIGFSETNITELAEGIQIEPPAEEGYTTLEIDHRNFSFVCHPGNLP